MNVKDRGFSLIELLIVVAIILTLAAIAIPNFFRSKISANEASAVSSLRTYFSAEMTYASTYNVGYCSNLTYLGPPPAGTPTSGNGSDLVDIILGGSGSNKAEKSGYLFTYTPAAPVDGRIYSFTFNADPGDRGLTGLNSYFMDETGVIRKNSNGVQATVSDTPIGG